MEPRVQIVPIIASEPREPITLSRVPTVGELVRIESVGDFRVLGVRHRAGNEANDVWLEALPTVEQVEAAIDAAKAWGNGAG